MTVLDWLLDSDPAIRWQALRDLADAPAEVVAAERARVATAGCGARLLALQGEDGLWEGGALFPARRGASAGGDPSDPDREPIREEIEGWKPHAVFNLLEEFHGETAYDQNVASYLELLRVPYTGCNPRGLMLARGKDLSKTLVAYHRIATPAFHVFPMQRKVRRPPRLQFPLIVKTLSEDASRGIAQASVVNSDEKLIERSAKLGAWALRVRSASSAKEAPSKTSSSWPPTWLT